MTRCGAASRQPRGFLYIFTLAAERPSARLSNDETESVAKRESVCRERSPDPIVITNGAWVTHGVEAVFCSLTFGVSVFTRLPMRFVLIYLYTRPYRLVDSCARE